MLFPTPNLLLPLVTPRASFTSAFISLAWIVGLPVAGLAALGLPTYRTLRTFCLSPVPSSLLAQSTRGCTCAAIDLFSRQGAPPATSSFQHLLSAAPGANPHQPHPGESTRQLASASLPLPTFTMHP